MSAAATTSEPLRVDVAISGGGLVGASLALALARLQLKVALIEATPFGAAEQPSFDERSTAISNGSRRIFEQRRGVVQKGYLGQLRGGSCLKQDQKPCLQKLRDLGPDLLDFRQVDGFHRVSPSLGVEPEAQEPADDHG